MRFDAPHRLTVEQLEMPTVVDPGDAVIRVTTTSIGPADLERYSGPDPAGPLTPGGACCGAVEAVGKRVRRWRPGDSVLVPSALRPSTDTSDQGGAEKQAANVVLGRDVAGSHAGWVRVPTADLNLIAVRDPLNHEAQIVVAAETYAIAARAAHHLAADHLTTRPLATRHLARVAVIGCDAACLAFMSALKSLKDVSGEVVALDTSPTRVLLARRLGAVGVVVRGAETASDAIRRQGREAHFDAVIVGARVEGASIDGVADIAGPGGAIVLLDPPGTGWSAPGVVEANGGRTLSAGFPDASELEKLAGTIEAGELDLLQLVSHTFPLEEAATAYEWALGKRRGVVKVLLKA